MSYNPFFNVENPQLMGYEYAWISFMKHNEINNTIISKEISRSWERCKKANLQPDLNGRRHDSGKQAESGVNAFLANNCGNLVAEIFENLDNGWFYGVITDRYGKKLFGLGNSS